MNPAIDYSVVVPSFRVEHVNRASGGRRDPGGKGVNAATVTARYGIDTAVTGFLGRENSLIFEEHFRNASIRDEFIYINGNTREGIKITDPKDNVTTDINFSGFTIQPQDTTRFIESFEILAAAYDWILLTGSLPPGLEPDFYARLAGIAAEAGARSAVDTSGEPLRLAAESGAVSLIKPNEHEIKEAFGDIDPADLLSQVEMVLLSKGEKGSLLYCAEGCYEASVPEVKAVTTVGAGDSFLAGFVSALVFGKDHADALAFASATAASKVTKYGPGISEDMPPGSFYDLIRVRKL